MTTKQERTLLAQGTRNGRAPLHAGLLLAGLLASALAGCATSTTVATQATRTGASVGSTPVATAATSAPAATATANQLSGSGAQQGIADVCTQPVSISAQLPSSIPPYPGAQLRVSQTSGGNGIFGYCSTDAVTSISLFYSTQLGNKGWQNMKATAIQDVNQIFASRANASLIITIEPDARVSGSTAIIIQTTGL